MHGVSKSSLKSHRFFSLIAAAAIATAISPETKAAILTFDPAGASPAAPIDASGTWDAGTTSNWSNSSDPSGQSPNSPADVAWPNSGTDTAIFGNGGGTPGTTTNYVVTVAAGGVKTGAITFGALAVGTSIPTTHGTDYQIVGAPITLSQPNTAITVNNVSSQNLVTIPDAEISSQLTGNSNVSITGAGTLTIGNIAAGAANNYVGITTISTSVSVGNVNSSNVRSATTVATPFGALNNSVVLSGGNITNNATGGTQAFQYAFTITANTNNTIFGSKVSQTTIGDTTSVPANPFGSVGGSGTLTFNAGGGGTSNIKANFSTFSGAFNLVGGGNVRAYTNGGAFTGSVGMAFDIESSPSVITTLSPQTNSGAGNIYNLGSLTSATASAILNGGSSGTATYSVGALGTNTTYAGVIGAGATLNAALTKVGGGSLTLTNNSAYTGATTVTGGTLLVNGTISASTATVGVNGTLGGVGTFTQMVNDNGTINPGATGPGSIGQLTLNGGITFGANATDAVDFNIAGSDLLAVAGNIVLGSNDTLTINSLDGTSSGIYTIATYSGTETGTFANIPGNVVVNYGTGTNSAITITVTPEPASMAILGLGILGLVRRRRSTM